MSDPTPIDDLRAAVTVFDDVAKNVRAEQLGDPTPCTQWSVRDLIEHMGAGAAAFAKQFGEQPADRGYEEGRDATLRALGRPVDLDAAVQMPFGQVPAALAVNLRGADSLVHAWDLAQATGQELTVDEELAERYIAFSQQALAQLPPEQEIFAPPVTPPADATALERLVALLGRQVG